MQKILIGENCELNSTWQELIDVLNEVYGYHDDMYWSEFFLDNSKVNDIRTDPKFHQAIINRNFILGVDWDSELICKIVEIPDDVKWHINSYACGVGEYICENHRTWY